MNLSKLCTKTVTAGTNNVTFLGLELDMNINWTGFSENGIVLNIEKTNIAKSTPHYFQNEPFQIVYQNNDSWD